MDGKIKAPDYGEHAVFLGSTGSGKSYLAEKMLDTKKHFIIFDTQDVFDDFKNAKIVKKPTDFLRALKNNQKRIIYKPRQEYMNKDINGYLIKEIANSSSKRQPNPQTVYIDEIFHLGFMQSFPAALPVAMATCRQKKISFWISTQRPKLIPTNIISEANYIYCFYLSKGDDIKYISQNVRTDRNNFIDLSNKMDKSEHKFIFMNLTNGNFELKNAVK